MWGASSGGGRSALSVAAVRRPTEAEPMRTSSSEGTQCANSLVTATCLLFLPSSMASITSSGLHTKRSVHPCGHKGTSQGSAVFSHCAATQRPGYEGRDHDIVQGEPWRKSDSRYFIFSVFPVFIIRSHKW